MITQTIPIRLINDAEQLPTRSDDHDAEINALAGSIAKHGLLHPIVVRHNGSGYTLIAGRRRLQAHIQLGKSEIQASLAETDTDLDAALTIAENLERRQLTPIEEAHAMAAALLQCDDGIEALAKRINRPVSWIDSRILLLDLHPQLIDAVHSGTLAKNTAQVLNRVKDHPDAPALYTQAINHGITARTATLWVQDLNADLPPEQIAVADQPPPPGPQTPYVTYVKCEVCRTEIPMTDAVHLLACPACVKSLHDIQQAPPTPK